MQLRGLTTTFAVFLLRSDVEQKPVPAENLPDLTINIAPWIERGKQKKRIEEEEEKEKNQNMKEQWKLL